MWAILVAAKSFSYWVAVSEAVFVSIPVSGAWNNVGIPGHAQCKLGIIVSRYRVGCYVQYLS